MGITLATGTTASIAKTYETALPFTAATNATETALTVVGSTIATGDYVEVTSGWGRLNGRVCRVKTGTATLITLEGIDTADTNKFPAGSGIGSVRKISAWTQLAESKSISASGGEQQYASATRLHDPLERQVPTRRSAIRLEIENFEDPGATWYADVVKADAAQVPYGVLLNFPNNSKLVANGYWTLPKIPNITSDEVMTVTTSVAFSAEAMRYAV